MSCLAVSIQRSRFCQGRKFFRAGLVLGASGLGASGLGTTGSKLFCGTFDSHLTISLQSVLCIVEMIGTQKIVVNNFIVGLIAADNTIRGGCNRYYENTGGDTNECERELPFYVGVGERGAPR